MTVPRLFTIKQFAAKHPAFPEGGLRNRVFHAKSNGLEEAGAILRNGRRVLIDEERFFFWLQEQNQDRTEEKIYPPLPGRG